MIIFTEGTAWNGVNVFRRNKHINETIQKNIRVKKKKKKRERERKRKKEKRETEDWREKKKRERTNRELTRNDCNLRDFLLN